MRKLGPIILMLTSLCGITTASSVASQPCVPVATRLRTFPHLGQEVMVEKCDATKGKISGRQFRNNKEMPPGELETLEIEEAMATYVERGALDNSMDQQVAECAAGTRKDLEVLAWARAPATSAVIVTSNSPALSGRKLGADPSTLMAQQTALASSCARAKAKFCQIATTLPIAIMTIDCANLKDIAYDHSIGRVFSYESDLKPATYCQGDTLAVVKNAPPFVYNFPPLTDLKGEGTQTCVIDNANVDNTIHNPGIIRMNPGASAGTVHHATISVGMVQSLGGSPMPGIAPNTQVYLADYTFPSQTVNSAAEWCASNAVRNWAVVVGDSSTSGNAAGAMLDYFSLKPPYAFIASVAGNEGASAVTNNPTTLNSLVVGYTDDKETPDRGDDTMSPNSNGANPPSPHGDLETPHLVSTGVDQFSSGWCATGSSVSTPQVAATGALIEQMNPDMDEWHEVKRAIILASADENIVGGANPLTAPPSNSVDGVGELNVQLALTIAKPENVHAMLGTPARYGYHFGLASAFTGWLNGAVPFQIDGYRVTVPAGVTGASLRVVFAWDATPCPGTPFVYGACQSSMPDADFDLYVCKLGANECLMSISFDNTWELVQTDVNAGETYNILSKRIRFQHP